MKAARQAAQEVNNLVAGVPTNLNRKTSRALVGSQPVSLGAPAQDRQLSPEAVDKGIDAAAQRHRVDPNLVAARVKLESHFNTQADSRRGAIGVMQLSAYT